MKIPQLFQQKKIVFSLEVFRRKKRVRLRPFIILWPVWRMFPRILSV